MKQIRGWKKFGLRYRGVWEIVGSRNRDSTAILFADCLARNISRHVIPQSWRGRAAVTAYSLPTPAILRVNVKELFWRVRPWIHETDTNSDRWDFRPAWSVYMRLVWTLFAFVTGMFSQPFHPEKSSRHVSFSLLSASLEPGPTPLLRMLKPKTRPVWALFVFTCVPGLQSDRSVSFMSAATHSNRNKPVCETSRKW